MSIYSLPFRAVIFAVSINVLVAVPSTSPVSANESLTTQQKPVASIYNGGSNRAGHIAKRQILQTEPENTTSTSEGGQINHRDNFELFATIVGVLGGITLITGFGTFCYTLVKKHKERVGRAREQEISRRVEEGKFLHNIFEHKQSFHMMPVGSEISITPVQPIPQAAAPVTETHLMPTLTQAQTQQEVGAEKPEQAFIDAVQAVIGGNIELLQQILTDNPDLINQADSNGDTLLHYAQNHAIARFLLRLGASPDSVNNDGIKPIHLAVRADNQRVIALLLDWMGFITFEDLSALFHISARSSAAQLRALVAASLHRRFSFESPHFASVNVNQLSIQTSSGLTLLHEAVIANNQDAVIFILDIGLIDVNAMDNYGNTPLHYAASSLEINASYDDHEQDDVQTIINILLNHGANFSAQNHFNATPLYNAVVRGNDATVRALLKTPQFKPRRRDGRARQWLLEEIIDQNLVLTLASLTPQIAARLFDINTQDRDGNTILHRACNAGKVERIKVLLRLGARTNIHNNQGQTPRELASVLPVEESASIISLFDTTVAGHQEAEAALEMEAL